MRYLPILILAGASLSLQAQSASGAAAAAGGADANLPHTATQASGNAAGQTATQADSAGTSFAQNSNVSAQLTKKIDTKNAKVGDEVLAKTTSNAQLTDGTKVPKGTKLMGQVTEVQAKQGAEKSSHLAFAMNKAILHDGREVPMHAMLTSVAPPMESTMTADDLGTSAGPISGSGGVSGGGRASGGGGLLGGAGRSTGGVVSSAGSMVGNTTNGIGSMTSSALRTTEGVGASGMGAVANAGSTAATRLDHVAVPNMPGVMLSSATDSTSSGSLDAQGRNIALESGTQMTMQVAAN